MPPSPSNAYSTGGGGVSLEHQYAATLLARLLSGAPSVELGDRIRLESVRLQASDLSPVDDLVLEGSGPDGSNHRASIGVRRDPKLNSADTASVPLIRAYLEVVVRNWKDVAAGRWSLTLAVAKNRQASLQVSQLAAFARANPDASTFLAAVARRGATTAQTRRRLEHLRALVREASQGHTDLSGVTVDELLWRWLSVLQVRVLRLEGADTADRTAAVAVLQSIVLDRTTASADSVFSRLAELSRGYASAAAQVTRGLLRRDLSAFNIERYAPDSRGWEMLDTLALLLRQQTGSSIAAGTNSIHLPRSGEVAALRAEVDAAASGGVGLVVTGEPDVGKSALALRVSADIRDEGAVVVDLSLRDLGGTVLDLQSALGVPLDDLFAGSGTALTRLLVVDGCEAVMEGLDPLFQALVAAAARAGFGVVCVTRADGAEFVRSAMARAYASAKPDTQVRTHTVRELLAEERIEIADSVPALARVLADDRSAWLLGRPGLIDAVLRSDARLEPGDLLCEGDIFAAVWNGLILRGGTRAAGSVAPEDREATAVAIALRRLGAPGTAPAGQALRELRSDGVLRAEANPAFSQGPDFSTDLYRDFALCKLFLFSGWEPLIKAGAPRWTIRAVRLACQARMTHPDAAVRSDVWDRLVLELDALAGSDGLRWSEVPYEALLTAGNARDAIAELWESLTAGEGLRTLFRLASGRYVEVGFGDQYALAPLIEVAFCERRDLGPTWPGSRESPLEVVQGLVLAWLRGMGRAGRGPDPLRQRVRDVILAQDHPLYSDFAVEALATLGSDLDEHAESWLRSVAEQRPSSLHPVAESVGVVLSLAPANPELLLELSEAYYIERPDPERDRYGWGSGGLHDTGIRDLHHGAMGFRGPQAGWYYGPFYRLLRVAPGKTISFINRMLDQAASHQVADAHQRPRDRPTASPDLPGLTLRLTESSGERHYVGDNSVWSWYRGTTTGSYPCMSALLALEKYIDELHEELGVTLARLVDILLADCNNLAVPGLLVGFLTRHLDEAGELLDPFLGNVGVWHLETARVTLEGGFGTRDADADLRTGQDKRRYTPHDVVGWMVVNARVHGDSARLEALEAIGGALLTSARQAVESPMPDEYQDDTGVDDDESQDDTYDDYLALVGSWAAEFTATNYEASEVDDQVMIQFQRPEALEDVLAPRNEELAEVQELYRLQAAYSLKNETPDEWPVAPLASDIATARRIIEVGPPAAFAWPENPLVAVAAAAVRAHALGLTVLTAEDLAWAAEFVLQGAENPREDELGVATSLFSMGADRAAAISAPLLLLDRFDGLAIDPKRISDALAALATSLYDEVRTAFAAGCAPVWEQRCQQYGGVCRRHTPVWQAVEYSLSAVRLGPWEYEAQRRKPLRLDGPYSETLPAVPTDELLLNRLRMPVVCTSAARAVPCVSAKADALSDSLWDAHRRAVDHWWRERYDHLSERHQAPVTKLLIDLAAEGQRDVLNSHLVTFAANASALHMFLQSFATVFSYDTERRRHLTDFWPPLLSTTLDAIGDGAGLRQESRSWTDYAIAAMLPTPQIESGDLDPDATLAACRDSWADPQAFDGVVDRWLTLAKGEPKAADAVAQFAKTASLEWQASTGLDWLEAIICDDIRRFSGRCWFVTNWLGELRASGGLTGPAIARYRRLIDGLAAGGDATAVSLQQLEE